MSITISLYNYLTVTTDTGEVKTAGSLTTPVSVSLASEKLIDSTVVLASDGDQVTLWDANDFGLGTFSFLYVEADKAIAIELQNDAGTAENAVLEIAANVPFILGSDELDATALSGAWATGDLIDHIEIEALSDATTVRFILGL